MNWLFAASIDTSDDRNYEAFSCVECAQSHQMQQGNKIISIYNYDVCYVKSVHMMKYHNS